MARFGTLFLFLAVIGPARSQTPAAKEIEADRRLLQDNGLPSEGPELLRFFRERILSKDQIEELARQAKMLASKNFGERQKAAGALLKAGALSREYLRDMIKSPDTDLETVRRAQGLLAKIAAGQDALLANATARLIAHQPPPESGQTLLDFIPLAADPRLVEELQKGLNLMAVKDGQIDAPFLAALKDALPGKRAAAGEAILRAGGLAHKKTIEPLLKDESPQVRLTVLIALVEAEDKKAVRALIDLLPVTAKDRIWQIEDMLQRIAGDKAPNIHVGAKTSAKLAHVSWIAWWQTNQQTVSLGKLSEPAKYRGFYLLTGPELNSKARENKFLEVRPSKQIPWQFKTTKFLTDAQYLTQERVLVAEGNKLFERDLNGNSYWEKEFDDGILGIQRFPSRDIFVATRRQLYLLDPVGIVVFSPKIQKVDEIDKDTDPKDIVTIRAAGRARDGHMIYINQEGECNWLDPDGLVARTFKVGQLGQINGLIDILPGQRILLPLSDKVAEFDRDGKQTWQIEVKGATAAVRLPNGNTLVATGQRVTEYNRDGQDVWSFQSPGPIRTLRRK